MKLNTLKSWMRLLSGPESSYTEGNLTVHVYGEEDQSYVVIEEEISPSPRVVDQYTIHALDEENGLFSLVKFLHVCDFDLMKVRSAVKNAEYLEDGMNDICRFEHVEIARYQLQEN